MVGLAHGRLFEDLAVPRRTRALANRAIAAAQNYRFYQTLSTASDPRHGLRRLRPGSVGSQDNECAFGKLCGTWRGG
jgi:hypothetical protein